MSISPREQRVLAIRCPTCGAKPGERCELTTGAPRTQSHVDRRLAAGKYKEADPGINTSD